MKFLTVVAILAQGVTALQTKGQDDQGDTYSDIKNKEKQTEADTVNWHIISTKSRGFLQTPQNIMDEYSGCSVHQYTRYRWIEPTKSPKIHKIRKRKDMIMLRQHKLRR